MRTFLSGLLVVSLALPIGAGCASAAGDANEDEVASTEDGLRSLLPSEILGTLAYGQTADVAYTYRPLYRAFRFEGAEGDVVRVKVTSADGEPYVWIVDDKSRSIGSATVAGAREAMVERTLAKSGAFYIVMRNRTHKPARFALALDGATASGPPARIGAGDVATAGDLAFGQKTSLVYTHDATDYYALSFRAVAGDRLDLDVTGEEPTGLLIDADGTVIASDAGASKATIRARAPRTGTYRLALRHTHFEDAEYTIALNAAFAREGIDPFDPSSCSGPALTNAHVAERLLPPAPGGSVHLGNHTLMARSRSCGASTCGPWGAPVKATLESTNAGRGPVAELMAAKLVRAPSGGVTLAFEQPGCFGVSRGTTCAIGTDGSFTCDAYRGSFRETQTPWPGCREGLITAARGPAPPLTGTARQHCARATTLLLGDTTQTELALLVQY